MSSDAMPSAASAPGVYSRGTLNEKDAPDGWLELFRAWFADALADPSVAEPSAMQLATADAAGRPSVRTVLMKDADEDGLVFYTNYESAKAVELAVNPHAAVVFSWLTLGRQVRIAGPVTKVTRVETEEYFATRPRGSQIGAWASHQSSVIAGRDVLESAAEQLTRRYEGVEVPAPPHWGGYRLRPEEVEFWQGRPDRLHDRLRYRRAERAWLRERLAP